MRKFAKKYRFVLILIAAALTLTAIRFFPREAILAEILVSAAVYDKNGVLLRLTLAEDETFRLFTPIDQISPQFINATLAYEDRLFYYHPGVNPAAIARGFVSSYIIKTRPIGGSTVTMQLARRLYGIRSSTVGGKLKQIICALWLEARYSKKDILEAYLNTAPYGHNIEGIGAASLIYFNKRSAELSTFESLTLAVVPQNPAKRLPTTERGLAELKKARDVFFQRWLNSHPEDEWLTPHFDLPMEIKTISALPFKSPHFVNSILSGNKSGGEIYTTLNSEIADAMEKSVKEFVADSVYLGIYNASALLVDASTMEVFGAVGSADFFNKEIEGEVDGTRARRSPGSTLKPFIYALAIDQGLIHTKTLLKDGKVRYGLYSPENSDRAFKGPISATDALNTSRNIPAVALLLKAGPDNFLALLTKMRIEKLETADYYGASLAIGGLEVTAEDIARLYATLINGGTGASLVKIRGETPEIYGEIMSPEAAYMVSEMLKSPSYRRTVRVGAKTGTSFRYKDGWTAGVFGNYVLAVWVGNFNGEANEAFMGRSSAYPLFFKIVNRVSQILPTIEEATEIPLGLNIKKVEICTATGELPGEYCPSKELALFIPGVSPIKESNIFIRIPIDNSTGLRACNKNAKGIHWEVFEFWEQDMLEIFEKAGMRRKTPPRYMGGCTIEEQSYRGISPSISYPQNNMIYDMTNAPMGNKEIPFVANGDADTEKLFWFLDGRFIGESENGKPLFWIPPNGQRTLRVVDNVGRGSGIVFTVR
ncbi:MAG: penicillin-binding protein 1C [Deferribacteraceae bacterium]|jgi:penicillin-binding protein 1C|nr:penicillin-binding protein 1C [Deferribacteraceae bacterium]